MDREPLKIGNVIKEPCDFMCKGFSWKVTTLPGHHAIDTGVVEI